MKIQMAYCANIYPKERTYQRYLRLSLIRLLKNSTVVLDKH